MMKNITDDTVVAVIEGPGDVRANTIAACTITFAFALIAVGSRFLTRRMAKLYIGWDDWLVLAALCVACADFGINMWWLPLGGGKYIGEVTQARLRKLLTDVFLVELFSNIIFFMARQSALILWLRIFPQRWVKHFCWSWSLLNVLFFIAAVSSTCLQCRPTRYAFNPLQAPPGACVSIKKIYVATSVVDIVLDMVVIGLPLYLVWQLKLNRAMKLAVSGMFLTSSLTIISTIVRLCILLRSDVSGKTALNVSWVYAEAGMWVSAETYIAIIAVCLPCLRPLLAKIVPQSWVPKSLSRTTKQSSDMTDVGIESQRLNRPSAVGSRKTLSSPQSKDTIDQQEKSGGVPQTVDAVV